MISPEQENAVIDLLNKGGSRKALYKYLNDNGLVVVTPLGGPSVLREIIPHDKKVKSKEVKT